METLQLQLDDQTIKRARRISQLRRRSLEELITEIIEQMRVDVPADNRLLGMFADEPELMDQVVSSAMTAREQHPLRNTREQVAA